MDGFFTIRETSEYLNVKISTLYAWAGKGVIPYYKFGGLIRFKKTEIEAWADSRRRVRVNSVPAPLKIPKNVADVDSIIESAKSSVLSASSRKARPITKGKNGRTA